MSTMNLSLPADQVSFIDHLVLRYKFANRSELVRSLIRLVRHEPALIETAATFPFVSPQKRSANAIISDFRKTKKYSKEFLKDLEDGLSFSDYFLS